MNAVPDSWTDPERVGRLFLAAVDEILGQSERCRLFPAGLGPAAPARPDPPGVVSSQQITQFQTELVDDIGPRAGRGTSLRIGRAFFRYWLQALGGELGLTNSAFRLLPASRRTQAGLTAIAHGFDQYLGIPVRFEADPLRWHFPSRDCPFCPAPGSEGGCDWMIGFLQEAMYWLSGGKIYQVIQEPLPAGEGGTSAVLCIDPHPIG